MFDSSPSECLWCRDVAIVCCNWIWRLPKWLFYSQYILKAYQHSQWLLGESHHCSCGLIVLLLCSCSEALISFYFMCRVFYAWHREEFTIISLGVHGPYVVKSEFVHFGISTVPHIRCSRHVPHQPKDIPLDVTNDWWIHFIVKHIILQTIAFSLANPASDIFILVEIFKRFKSHMRIPHRYDNTCKNGKSSI